MALDNSSKMNSNFICFTTFPKINDLLYVYTIISKREKIKLSCYNSVIIKCRQLIFENGEVIAYPEVDEKYGIVIVFKESFYCEGKLTACLNKYNLKSTGPPSAVSRYIYERCCYYTILAKIAPKWNTISSYFVKGRNFLSNTNPMDGLSMFIRINENGDTSFHCNTNRIKMPVMSLEKLNLPKKNLQELNTNNFTNLQFCENKTVRVLPSLKTGKIISIRKILTLATDNTLVSYKYMKRHWKNTYGYRLPEDDKNMLYFEITFFKDSPIFTYPSICVRPYDPAILKRVDPLPVVNEFFLDLMKAVPTILGEKYKIPSNISLPTISFSSVSQQLNHANIIPYTPENHFHPNKNISDTQNSAFVVLRTQNSTQMQREKTSAISQFVQELERQQNTCINVSNLQTSNSTIVSETTIMTKEEVTKEEMTKEEMTKEEMTKEEMTKEEMTKEEIAKEEMTKQIETPQSTKICSPKINTNKESSTKCIPQIKQNISTNVITNAQTTKSKIIMDSTSNQNITKQDNSLNFSKERYTSLNIKINDKPNLLKKINLSDKKNVIQYNTIIEENHVDKKRKLDVNEIRNENLDSKKNKLIPKDILDMELRVKNNAVDKLTISMLITWLKEKEIRYSVKDKKSDLVKRVIEFFK